MPAFEKAVIEDVPGNALDLFRQEALRSGNSVTDTINWCLIRLARPSPRSTFYWVENHERSDESLTAISCDPVAGGTPTELTVNLTTAAKRALDQSKTRYRSDEASVIARAAQLAAYIDRKDGRLAYGIVAGNQVISVSALRFIT